MPKITVYLLNFHGPVTHIEIVLKNNSTGAFYLINRWETARNSFSNDAEMFKLKINEASCIYRFDIEANPDEIADEWYSYYHQTQHKESILSHNCAVAAQWFLTRFANIPEPNFFSAPITINHVACGLFIPSIIPVGVTLPGRIMSNAKFYIQAREDSKLTTKYTNQLLRLCFAISALSITTSIIGLITASVILDDGSIRKSILAGCTVAGAVSLYGLFTTFNACATKESIRKIKAGDYTTVDILDICKKGKEELFYLSTLTV